MLPVVEVGPGSGEHAHDQLPQVDSQRLHRRKGVLAVEGVVREQAALILGEAPIFQTAPESKQGVEVQEGHQLQKRNRSFRA